MHFISKSQQRRFEAQRNVKKPDPIIKHQGCVFISFGADAPYRPNKADMCGKPAANGRHGWLCEEHLKLSEPLAASLLPHQRRAFETEQDNRLIAGILKTEQEAIINGLITTVKFGKIEPLFLRYWSPA